jgi:hypothetical protein
MVQQYSTPDGSIWEQSSEPFTWTFIRVDSPDNSHEDDFRPQKFNEVLKHWGPMSLHDPYAEELNWLKSVLFGIHWTSDSALFAKRLQGEFRKKDIRLVKEEE